MCGDSVRVVSNARKKEPDIIARADERGVDLVLSHQTSHRPSSSPRVVQLLRSHSLFGAAEKFGFFKTNFWKCYQSSERPTHKERRPSGVSTKNEREQFVERTEETVRRSRV